MTSTLVNSNINIIERRNPISNACLYRMLQDNWKHVIFWSFALLEFVKPKLIFLWIQKITVPFVNLVLYLTLLFCIRLSMAQRKYVVIMVRSWKLFSKRKYLVVVTFGMKMLCILSKVKGNVIFLIWRMKYLFYFICKNLGKKEKSKMIICCQCSFDIYLLKINKEEDFFKNLNSHNPSNWSEETIEFPDIIGPFWFRTAHAILFHTCYDRLMKRVGIVTSINNLTVGLTFAMGCKYPDNTWYEAPTDLEKGCEQCYLKMCLRICKRLFYILDPSYIIKKWIRSYSLCRLCSFFFFFWCIWCGVLFW